MSTSNQDVLCGLLVAVVAAVLFLPGLGGFTLLDRDEPRFAEAGRLMLATGDYVVPYFNGEVRYHKPPLIYWVMAGAYAAFGVSEFGARVGSAVAGIASCVLIFIIARSMFGRRAALIAAIVAATTVQVFIEARTATADAVLLATILAMFLGFWRIHTGRRGAGSYLLLYGGLAAGSLTKGPVSVCVLLVSVAIYSLLRRSYPPVTDLPAQADVWRLQARVIRDLIPRLRLWWGELRRAARELHLLPGMLAAAAVVGAWFVPAVVRTGGGFWREGVLSHVVERAFARSFEGHKGVPVVFYLLVLPVFFFPWFAVLPESIRQVWKSRSDRGRRAFLIGWAAAPYLVFSFLRTKLPHYVLPAYPAFAIMCGAALDRAMTEGRSFWKSGLGKLGLVGFALAGVCFAAGIVLFPASKGLPGLAWGAVPAALAALLLTGLGSADLARGKNRRATAVTAGFMAATMLALAMIACPALEDTFTYKDLAGAAETALPGAPVACLGVRAPSLVFYLRRRVDFLSSVDAVRKLAQRDARLICIAKSYFDEPLERIGGRRLEDLRCFNIEKMKWENITLWEIDQESKDVDQGP